MEKITSFVVEDNINALQMLIQDIKNELTELEIIGSASHIIEAVKKLQKKQPDILFLDIMLGDGTAFDILEMIPNLKSRVIFITASDEYAIKAFKFAAIDYILKPYSIEDLKESVKKAKNSLAIREEQINILNDLVTTPNNIPTKISLHTSEKIVIVDIINIIKCKSDSNYTTFYFKDKTKIMVSKTLKYYSDLLKDNNFIRVHQSYLINKEYIKEFIKSDGGYLILQDNTTVPVSSRKKPEIISILKEI